MKRIRIIDSTPPPWEPTSRDWMRIQAVGEMRGLLIFREEAYEICRKYHDMMIAGDRTRALGDMGLEELYDSIREFFEVIQ